MKQRIFKVLSNVWQFIGDAILMAAADEYESFIAPPPEEYVEPRQDEQR